jgi:hypothetical protein
LRSFAELAKYDERMTTAPRKPRQLFPPVRVVIEVGFIIFLFYANLLMGEFTRGNSHGKTLLFAVKDIFTGVNFLIAVIAALIGHLVFEALRKRL